MMSGLLERWREIGGDSLDESETTTYVRNFQAFARSPSEVGTVRLVDVKADPRCPKRYQRDTEQPRGWVDSVRVIRDPQKIRLFDIEVGYAPNLIEENDPDPLARPATISWKSAYRQVAVTQDLDEKPIINTAGELMAGVMVDEPYFIATVKKNIRPGPAPWLLSYRNTVNLDAITLDGLRFNKGILLLRDLQIGDVQTENDVRFRQASFELWQNERGWQLGLWNRGLSERVEEFVVVTTTTPATTSTPPTIPTTTVSTEGVTVLKRIHDDQGEPVSEPQFLNEDGGAFYEVGSDNFARLKHPLDPSDLIKLKFRIRGKKRFRDLPLR